jgi:alkylation response protein AidB-like acyl-CoA dehydrogenase
MSSGLDLDLDDAQRAIAGAVGQFCADRCPDDEVKALAGRFPEALWRELAELGVLALVTPEADGGATELVAALEALGRAVFPGPLPATFLATQVLGSGERRDVSSGAVLASVGSPPLMPWAPVAGIFVQVEGDRALLARPVGAVEPLETLGGEPWGRVSLERVEDLGPATRGIVLYEIALAAYLAAAGRRLVDDTAEHARTRKQYGRAIGEFQAVAHPLADCAVRLDGAGTLARAAAHHFDQGGEVPAGAPAAAARISASRAALEAAHVCHQLFGAVGITLEGPVFHVSRRIRQLVSQPPGEGTARAALLRRFDL